MLRLQARFVAGASRIEPTRPALRCADSGTRYGSRPCWPLRRSAMDTSLPVLVVDDSRATALAISDLLHKVGFADVDVAHDAHSAPDQLRDKNYGLVLSDWEMQPMGGNELLQAMRQNGKLGKIPVIVMTASGGRGASWLAGAAAYLRKPFNEGELRQAIQRL